MDRCVVGLSAGRDVDHPCGGQISPWPARKVTDTKFRESVMSANFSPAVPGPEMAVPILWAPGISGLFLQEKNSMPIKFLAFRVFFFGGGGKCQFYYYGRGDFPEKWSFKADHEVLVVFFLSNMPTIFHCKNVRAPNPSRMAIRGRTA